MSLAKRRYSIEETSRVEYSEYAKNLFHDGSLGIVPYNLGCWQQQGSLMCLSCPP